MLPEIGIDVLIFDGIRIEIGHTMTELDKKYSECFQEINDYTFDNLNWNHPSNHVIYWMPLPSPPKQEETK